MRRKMCPYILQPIGQTYEATISRVEIKKASEVFTSKEGKFMGEFSKPSDPVLVVYARAQGVDKDTKVGTFNIPNSNQIHAKSHMHKFLRSFPEVKQWSDDFRELKGRKVEVVNDESGFTDFMSGLDETRLIGLLGSVGRQG